MYELVCVVWGPAYTHKLIHCCLPSLMAAGNLPTWPFLSQTILHIITPQDDWEVIQDAAIIDAIADLIPIKWTPLELSEMTQQPWIHYQVVSYVHQHILQQAHEEALTVVFVIPDAVYSDGLLGHLASRLAMGQTFIVTLGLRVIADACMQALPKVTPALTLSALEASEKVFQFLHPEYRSYFWFDPLFNRISPACTFYCTEDGFAAAHAYVLTPLLIRHPLPLNAAFSSIDGGYQHGYFERLSTGQIGVILPEQAVVFSLTPEVTLLAHSSAPVPYGLRSILMYKLLKRYYIHPLRHWYYSHRFEFKTPVMLPPEQIHLYHEARAHAPWEAAELIWYLETLWLHQHFDVICQQWQDPHIRHILEQISHSQLGFVWHYIVLALQHMGQEQAVKEITCQYRHYLKRAQFGLARDPTARYRTSLSTEP